MPADRSLQALVAAAAVQWYSPQCGGFVAISILKCHVPVARSLDCNAVTVHQDGTWTNRRVRRICWRHGHLPGWQEEWQAQAHAQGIGLHHDLRPPAEEQTATST